LTHLWRRCLWIAALKANLKSEMTFGERPEYVASQYYHITN
jgi:hypothetical protein